MTKIPFTDLALRKLPYTERGQKRYWDTTTPGFGITVGTRAKTYICMTGEDRRMMTLGRYPDKSLKDARQEAKVVLATSTGTRPSMSDSEALKAFLKDCEGRLRASTAERYRYALAPHMDKIDPNTNDPNELKALKAFYNWCLDRDIRDRNPFARRKVQFAVRDRLLTDDEIKRIYAYDRPPYSIVVKLLLLTGQRRGQIAGFDPDWVEGDTIVFPASIMKSSRVHVVPLTETVQELLPHLSSFSGWSKSKRRMDKAINVHNWVLHDLRRYFSSTMAQLGVPLHVTEHILDHRSQITGVAEIYNRYSFLPEMREALETYEAHIATLVAPGPSATRAVAIAPTNGADRDKAAIEEGSVP